jgi:hypothetical protein
VSSKCRKELFKNFLDWGLEAVEHLPSKYKALSSILSPGKKILKIFFGEVTNT